MNHLIEQAPASDAMEIVRALRISQEVREYFPREVLALLRRWLRHLNGPYRREMGKQERSHAARSLFPRFYLDCLRYSRREVGQQRPGTGF